MASVNGRAYVIGGSNDEHGYRRDVLKVQYYKSSVRFLYLLQWYRSLIHDYKHFFLYNTFIYSFICKYVNIE